MIKRSLLSTDLARPIWDKQDYRSLERIWLDKNECSDPDMQNIVFDALSKVTVNEIYSYPNLNNLYKKLSNFVGVSSDNLLITNGSDGAIRSCFEATIEPGDKIVLTRPSFAMYDVYSKIYGADVSWLDYSATPDGPYLDIKQIISVIKETMPKLVCLPNPDSPTGTVFSPDDLRMIIVAAGKVDALILIDEAYHPFYSWSAAPWIFEYSHLLVVRSFSKAWGAAGLRVGYAIANKDLISYINKQKPMYEIGNVSAKATEYLLNHVDDMMLSVSKINAGKKYFQDAMLALGLTTYECHGNFLHVQFGEYETEIHKKLEPLVYYRKSFSEESLMGYSRFSATTKEQFAPIVGCIKQIVKVDDWSN